MADKGSYKITVEVIDQASARFKKINDNIAKSQAPLKKFNAQWERFGKLTGLTKTIKGLESFAKGAGKAGLAVAGIAGVASVGGIYELAKGFGTAGVNAGILAKHIGMSTYNLTAMQNAGQLAGMSVESIGKGVESLQDKLQDAFAGRDNLARRVFNAIGVDPSKGNTDDALAKIRATYQKLGDGPQAAVKKRQLLAITGTSEFEPQFQESDADYASDKKKGAANAAFNSPGVEAATRLNKAFIDLQQNTMGLKYAIGEALEPVLTPLVGTISEGVHHLSEWIKANQGLIQTKVKEWLTPILEYIKHLDFQKLAHDIKLAAAGFGLILALPIAANFLSVAASVVSIGSAIGKILLMSPQLSAALAAAGAVYLAYTRTKDAYEDYLDRGKKGKQEKKDRADLQARVNALPPDKRAAFDELQKKHGFNVMGDSSPFVNKLKNSALDAQKHVANLPSNIGKGAIGDVMKAWESMKYSHGDAAAMTSSMFSESGLNPFAVGDGGKAYGAHQWHGDRQAISAKLLGHTMQSVQDKAQALKEQMWFADWELHNTEKHAYDKMEAAHSDYDKGAAISKYYERPAAVEEAARNRGNLAAQIASSTPLNGNIKVDINHNNAPKGSTVVASASGNAFASAPKVYTAMTTGLP